MGWFTDEQCKHQESGWKHQGQYYSVYPNRRDNRKCRASNWWSRQADGKVFIRAQRSPQTQIDRNRPEIIGFEIEDNGIGFTDAHRDSFDTLYTDQRIDKGGKGFGRFTCLKYFENLKVRSVFEDDGSYNKNKKQIKKKKKKICWMFLITYWIKYYIWIKVK